jgi:sulfatase maturation enzyme AslB (radical SAM superfamily)
MSVTVPERVSIELSTRCGKGCHFCYNASGPERTEAWSPVDVITLVRSLADHGTRAVSLGGGEPLEYDGLEEICDGLRAHVFLSMTTNGLLLDDQLERVSRLNPAKVHISVHYPSRDAEVERVIRQVQLLRRMGIRSGVNLLVRADRVAEAASAAARIRDAGIGNGAIVYLPMRGQNTPTPVQMAQVAGSTAFQSMTCLMGCGASPQFCSIDASRRVAHCSYTKTRRELASLDAAGLAQSLEELGLAFCGAAS